MTKERRGAAPAKMNRARRPVSRRDDTTAMQMRSDVRRRAVADALRIVAAVLIIYGWMVPVALLEAM